MTELKNPDDTFAVVADVEGAAPAYSNADDNAAADSGEKVGYCKPPKVTQFKKGQSGNPLGRKKSQPKTLKESFLVHAMKKVSAITTSGKHETTQFDAVVTLLFNKALKGNSAAIKLVLSLGAKFIEPKEAQIEKLQEQATGLGCHIYTPEMERGVTRMKELYGPSSNSKNNKTSAGND